LPVGAARLNNGAPGAAKYVSVAYARLLAKHLGRTNARAHAAERIGFEDGLGRTAVVVLRDALDEARDVDTGGASRDAGCVVAVVAALGLDQRLRARQRRMGVGEVAGVLVRRKPPRLQARLALRLGTGRALFNGCHDVRFSSGDEHHRREPDAPLQGWPVATLEAPW